MSTNEPIALIKQSLANLNVQRQSLEEEASAIASELEAKDPNDPNKAPMGVHTPLVDKDGYPRGDIDVFRARELRNRLATIQTDHKQLMRQIETKLQQLALVTGGGGGTTDQAKARAARQQSKPKPKFDPVSGKWVVCNSDGTLAGAGPEAVPRQFESLSIAAKNTTTTTNNTATTTAATPEPTTWHRVHTTTTTDHTVWTTPFARVESVAEHSPAAEAGLQVGDCLLAFGPCTSLPAVPELVRTCASARHGIELHVLRGDHPILLRLRPRPWQGRGLLGCHIVPV